METLREHLKNRHLHTKLYAMVVDEESRIVTFFLFNLSNKVVGYHQYRPDADKTRNNDPKLSRYYTYVTKGELPVFGLETLTGNPNETVYLTEGVFDVCRLHNYGLPALAVLSNHPKHLRNFLNLLPNPKVAVCDGDAAGRKLANLVKSAIFLPEGKDLGDLTEPEVRDLLLNNGIDAILQF